MLPVGPTPRDSVASASAPPAFYALGEPNEVVYIGSYSKLIGGRPIK